MVANVTTRQPGGGPAFTRVSTGYTILPGNGNYRYYLNAGIISGEMERIVMDAGCGSAAVRPVRGNRR